MTLLIDSGALFTALTPDEPGHATALQALEAEQPPFVLSPFVLAELDYFLLDRGGVDQELRFLREVAEERYLLALMDAADIAAAGDIARRYLDLRIGLADASIVLLAGRHRTTRVFTVDEKHFRSMTTPDGKPFTILPADA